MSVGVWTERLRGRGEDAEPLLVHHVPTGEGIAAVFDGSGGSGSAAALELPAGRPRSGAWVGARVARTAAESWFHATVAEAGRGGRHGHPAALEERMTGLLTPMRSGRSSRLVGNIRRELPTTMAAVRYRRGERRVGLRALWAGDSRAYVLSPWAGLQALTRDHTAETDALEQLVQDPPMTNVICADRPFRIDEAAAEFDLPCVLVCATDGFFGYVDTPAHFEWHVLHALREARDAAEWADLLCAAVAAYTADDASLAVVALGYRGFEDLRGCFARRADTVARAYWLGRERQGDPGFREWRHRTWRAYRPDYERRIPAEPRMPT
ncbi:serine/threonine protein phosphatase [Actinomadura graeca]|uniref:Serine/threonine protein phosphatase n=1 Tax=Actinomadura graeca TaxID=2750812 RepID=A0ABX8R6T7_9ACTN|nr:serine/threonine protein phosphatase [Actinomadura graeca]